MTATLPPITAKITLQQELPVLPIVPLIEAFLASQVGQTITHDVITALIAHLENHAARSNVTLALEPKTTP